MKERLGIVVLSILLLSVSAYAQRQLRTVKNIRAGVQAAKAPSLSSRVTAAVRRQTLALPRLQRIKAIRSWRIQNPSLVQELSTDGFLLEKIPSGGHAFSSNGVTWYEANEMMLKAIYDGRIVRVGDGGELKVALYKGGPEFKFYDENLFKELDRSKYLGLELVEREGYVSVSFPKEFENTRIVWDAVVFQEYNVLRELSPYNVAPYTHAMFIQEHPLFTRWENVGVIDGLAVSKTEGGFVGSYRADANSVKGLNDWYEGFKKAAEKIKPYEGQFNMSVFYRGHGPEKGFWIQDSRGVLYKPENIEAAVVAEKGARLLPALPVEIPLPGLPMAPVAPSALEFEEIF